MCKNVPGVKKPLENSKFVSNLSIYNVGTLNEAHLISKVSATSVTKANKK